MQYLLDFLSLKLKDTKIYELIQCSEEEGEILKYLSKNYISGNSSVCVYELLQALFDTNDYKYLKHLNQIKNLLDAGWISCTAGLFRSEQNRQNNGLLQLLQAEISLSNAFLKILEDGNLKIKLPKPSPYEDHLQYLKDRFLMVELYEKNLLLFGSKDAQKRVKDEIQTLEKHIKSRLKLTKIDINIEQIFKENSLNTKEQIIFLMLLKQEYSGEFENLRELSNLVSLISDDEFERIKNRSLLDDSSKLVESGLIEYDEILNPFGNISRNFFINDEILQTIMHAQNSKSSKKIKLETLVKEQEIFEIIEPSTSIDDVVLNEKTKELLDSILKQVDRKVLSRLNSWGIKSRKMIDAKIIFYGEPGTGKTMSAIGLAKSLKKQILSFDCSKILSKYVGESEQNVRKIFDTYKDICKKSKTEPVLLLNEADQFLSTRVESSTSSDKMHNQMQNIFLEQIEKFQGVMIATTNFLQSFDVAFSRRFDYKIEFKKPDFNQRLVIWQKVLPESACFEDGFDLNELASYKLSGAQIVLVLKNTALAVAVKDDGIFTMQEFKTVIQREMASAFGEDKKMGFGS